MRSFAPAARIYGLGSARSRSPDETLARLLPHLSRYGITRLAGVTGLDRIGIPVYQAVRPNSRSLSVSQGKGIDHAAAKVSALMEALECHHAEYATCSLRMESHRVLSRRERVTDPLSLPLSRHSEFSGERSLPWVQGEELGSGEPVFIPWELVHANATLPRVPGSGCFVFSTNGLASGNNFSEAVLHGVCELIERDAQALWNLLVCEEQRQSRIDPGSIDDPTANALLGRYADAGIELMLWDMTSDVGVAAVRAILFDRDSDPELNPYPAAYGAGCHPERAIALCRALTEAAQSRLTAIAGARDDLTDDRYAQTQRAAVLDHFRELSREAGVRAFSALPDAVFQSLDAELDFVRSRLCAAGLSQALVVDLSTPELDFAFVRCVIPGLEGPAQSPSYRPGARARKRAALRQDREVHE
jgi:ribosomal protein S12 methylthiotransferase accessory factor